MRGLTKEQLTKLRHDLSDRRAKLLAEKGRLEAQSCFVSYEDEVNQTVSRHRPFERDRDDVLSDPSVALERLETMARELAAIQDTEGRIYSGEFGVCRSCHRAIPVGRLLAVPQAELCQACQVAQDQGIAYPAMI